MPLEQFERENTFMAKVFLLRSQTHLNFKFTWKKGATNSADYASRHATPLSHLPKHIQQESEEYSKLCWFLHRPPYMECLSTAALQEHTNKDEILQEFPSIFYTIENLRLQVTVQLIQRFLMN